MQHALPEPADAFFSGKEVDRENEADHPSRNIPAEFGYARRYLRTILRNEFRQSFKKILGCREQSLEIMHYGAGADFFEPRRQSRDVYVFVRKKPHDAVIQLRNQHTDDQHYQYQHDKLRDNESQDPPEPGLSYTPEDFVLKQPHHRINEIRNDPACYHRIKIVSDTPNCMPYHAKMCKNEIKKHPDADRYRKRIPFLISERISFQLRCLLPDKWI